MSKFVAFVFSSQFLFVSTLLQATLSLSLFLSLYLSKKKLSKRRREGEREHVRERERANKLTVTGESMPVKRRSQSGSLIFGKIW